MKWVLFCLVAAFALLLAVAESTPLPAQQAGAASVGDANCDSSVSSVDAAIILQLVAGLIPSVACQANADANQDGLVTSVDAALILQFVAGLISSLPPETLRPLEDQGLAYGPFRDGQGPPWVYPNREEIREDLSQLLLITSKIRTYGSSGPMMAIAEEAANLGFSVTAGAFLGADVAVNEEEIAAVIELANDGFVDSVVVGNETQLVGTVSEAALLDYISQVKASVPSAVAVTSAEPWEMWLQRPQLLEAVDYVLIHIHPFWEARPIADAASYVVTRYLEVSSETDKDVVVGETGWPSGGSSELTGVPGNVVASAENQRRMLTEFTRLAERNGIQFFWFDAYDEEWKWAEGLRELTLPLDRNLSGRFVGASWGLFRSDGRMKEHLADLFPNVPEHSSRTERTIFDERGLATFYDIGVDSSRQRRDWLERTEESMRMAYPSGQSWGAVFITVGEPVQPPRPWKDFSSFRTVTVDLRGEVGEESVAVGIKDATDPDNGTESRTLVEGLAASWQTYEFQLDDFITADLQKLYVVMEFIFSGSLAQTVYFRNVKYLP